MSELIELNRPAIIDELIDGEVVAVDLERGSYYSIQGAGVQIWYALAEPETADGVARRIAAMFGADEATLAPAVEAFLAELALHQLVRVSDGSPAPPAGEPPPLPAGVEFEPPRLERFTDMEDLLMLDPVHEVDSRGWPHVAPR